MLETLRPAEAATLAAIHAQLIPTDDCGPGAAEANTIRYVDRALGGRLARHRSSYARNLVALDAWSISRSGAEFAALDPADRDDVLRELEAGSAEGFEPSASAFFELLRLHAIEGMFADPHHGGNTGGVGWDLVGFPRPKVVFTAEEQRLEVDVEPVRPRRA
jgi:gluconate 2-dehydrogenase gamma chain